MGMFIARLSDGSCVIADVDSEHQLRELAEIHLEDRVRIVTVRELRPCSFWSRWWLDETGRDGLLPGRLDGDLQDELVEETYANEYPMIAAAHSGADADVPLVRPDLPSGTSVLDPRQMKQMHDWQSNLIARLRQAIEIEIGRYQS